MGAVLLNTSFYAFFWLYFFLKNRSFDNTLLLLTTYLLVSSLGIYIYCLEPEEWNLSYWAFGYFFVVFIIFTLPLLICNVKKINYVKACDRKILFSFVLIYIIVSFIVIVSSCQKSINALMNGEWLQIRMELYAGEYVPYDNQIERIAINVVEQFRLLLIVLLFYGLSGFNVFKNKFMIVLIALSVILPVFLLSILTAARGTMFMFTIQLITVYLFFKRFLSNNINLILKRTFFCFSFLVVLFSVSVTLSRFDTDASDSLFFYFGHSMLAFNYGVVDTIEHFANGRWILGSFFESFFEADSFIDFNKLGTHFGTSFITFIGCLYVDFGPVGTFVAAIVACFFFSMILCKKNRTVSIATVYLYLFYVNFLIEGVFVYGKAYGFDIFMAILIYLALKFRVFILSN